MKKTILVIDLVSSKKLNIIENFPDRILNPNMVSLMPQIICVWIEELGHNAIYFTYTGFENLKEELPKDLDLVIISSNTISAYLAYSISNYYRSLGIFTILGGPHAKAFSKDAGNYFDCIVGNIDKILLSDIIRNPNRLGSFISTDKKIEDFPTLEQRWKYIQYNINKFPYYRSISTNNSIGCPFKCNFCIEFNNKYYQLSDDHIIDNIKFLNRFNKKFTVIWYDPNFGSGISRCLNLLEKHFTNHKNISFGMESNLSELDEKTIIRLKRNNFKIIAPGLESWFKFNNKSGLIHKSPFEKMIYISDQLNMMSEHINFIQLNFIFGIDSDYGDQPFELTKEFIRRVPNIYPNFQIITAFGTDIPLGNKLDKDDKLIDIPYNLLDCSSITNVKLDYDLIRFYNLMHDISNTAFSYKNVLNRIKNSKDFSIKSFYLLKKIYGYDRSKFYKTFLNKLLNNKKFLDFHLGNNKIIPLEYKDKLKKELGDFYNFLPSKIRIRYEQS